MLIRRLSRVQGKGNEWVVEPYEGDLGDANAAAQRMLCRLCVSE